jgi:hypothetical protein
MNRDNSGKVKISVIDTAGNLVLLQHIILTDTNHSFVINGINKLPPGNYTTVLKWESGKTVTKKITKT